MVGRHGETQVSRVTVSVPRQLLDAVDEKLIQPDETRSAFIRRLLEKALREAEESKDIERYVRGYSEHPQSDDDIGWPPEASLQSLDELPWKPRQ